MSHPVSTPFAGRVPGRSQAGRHRAKTVPRTVHVHGGPLGGSVDVPVGRGAPGRHPSLQRLHRYAVAATTALIAAYGFGEAPPAHAATKGGPITSVDQVARGRYLVSTSACMDCHTPLKMGPNGPEPDLSRLLSGHPETLAMPPVPALPEGPWLMIGSATNTAWAGPWGVSFTANLTPDPETGLGQWTVDDFKRTIRTGRHLGRGREILPPMPIPVYNHFSDADLEAVFAYLKTIPPVKNRVPEPWAPPAAPTASR